jgi:uncharacterized protein YfeS
LEQAHSHGGGAATGKNQTNSSTLQQKLESEEKYAFIIFTKYLITAFDHFKLINIFRYKDINARLRKLLAEERKSLLQVFF